MSRLPKRPKWRRKMRRIARRLARRNGHPVTWQQATRTMRYRWTLTLPGAINGPIVVAWTP